MFGFRQLILLCSIAQAVAFLTLGPAIAFALGHLKYPNILLSDLMLLDMYSGLSTFSLTIASAATAFVWLDVFRHMRRAMPEASAELDCTVMCVTFLAFPGITMALSFSFSEENPWVFFAHCFGTAMAFVGCGLASLVWIFRVAPIAAKRGAEHPWDAWWRRKHCFWLIVQACVAGAVRFFHLRNKAGWCLPLLLCEVGFGVNVFTLAVTGNWNHAREYDRMDPIMFSPIRSDPAERRKGA